MLSTMYSKRIYKRHEPSFGASSSHCTSKDMGVKEAVWVEAALCDRGDSEDVGGKGVGGRPDMGVKQIQVLGRQQR